MSELVIASSEADTYAAEAVKQHHATMAGALSLRIDALFTVAAQRDTAAAEAARRKLIDWWPGMPADVARWTRPGPRSWMPARLRTPSGTRPSSVPSRAYAPAKD